MRNAERALPPAAPRLRALVVHVRLVMAVLVTAIHDQGAPLFGAANPAWGGHYRQLGVKPWMAVTGMTGTAMTLGVGE